MPDQVDSSAPPLQDFTVTRVFDASRELIWSALTDPEQLVRFWGPEGTTIPIDSISNDFQNQVCNFDFFTISILSVSHNMGVKN